MKYTLPSAFLAGLAFLVSLGSSDTSQAQQPKVFNNQAIQV